MAQNLDIGPLQSGSRLDIGARQSSSALPNTIVPGFFTSAQVWPTPAVAGPISGTCTIPTSESWPSPTVTESQAISGTCTIPTSESWPSPTVHHVQVISGTCTIPTSESWPSPTVSAGPQYVNVFGIPTAENWPSPLVTGGASNFHIYLSNVDVSQFFNYAYQCTVASQTLGRWTATWTMFCGDGSFVPVLGQTVLIIDPSGRIFSGCLSEVKIRRLMSTATDIFFDLTATDKSGICDHRVVVQTYPANDPITGTPTDLATTILSIVTNSLNGEGITPGPEIAVGAMGTQDVDLNWNFPTVTNAFDQICSNEGFVWWIDNMQILHFAALDTLPDAPFSLTETSDNWRNLVLTKTTQNYYNKLYAVTNLNILPQGSGTQTGITETFDLAPDEPGVITITSAFGTRIAVGIQTSQAIGSVLSMTVNGAAQTVVQFQQWHGQTSTGGSDYLWFYATGNNQLNWTFGPPVSSIVVVTYTPYVPSSASTAQYGSALKPLNPGGQPLGTCGSGIYEGVIQLQNVATIDDLNATAAAELSRIGGIPNVVDFETDQPGLKPGQLLSVNIPLIGAVNLSMMITSASGTFIRDLNPQGWFRWKIQATTNLDPGNWFKWYERLVARTNNLLPVLQYETATFILGSGSVLSGGTNLANPYIAGHTGQLFQVQLAAAQPPVDQTLVLTITDSNQQIVQISMPPTTAANQLITQEVATTPQIFVFRGDILNVSASYLVTGPDPAAASNVTLQVQWSF